VSRSVDNTLVVSSRSFNAALVASVPATSFNLISVAKLYVPKVAAVTKSTLTVSRAVDNALVASSASCNFAFVASVPTTESRSVRVAYIAKLSLTVFRSAEVANTRVASVKLEAVTKPVTEAKLSLVTNALVAEVSPSFVTRLLIADSSCAGVTAGLVAPACVRCKRCLICTNDPISFVTLFGRCGVSFLVHLHINFICFVCNE
jgi:hypothetical protein